MASELLGLLSPHYDTITERLKIDEELRAALTTCLRSGVGESIAFGLDLSATGQTWLYFALTTKTAPDGTGTVLAAVLPENLALSAMLFSLQAREEDWYSFFRPPNELVRPYQSFWGMLRILGPDGHVSIGGDIKEFGRCARVWRIVLDRIRDVVCNTSTSNIPDISSPHTPSATTPVDDTAEITGKYLQATHRTYGSLRLFYEFSGHGPQIILFLHTAGSDSRQHHSLMLLSALQKTCTMYAFDLPAHGRSSLGSKMIPEAYALTEDDYLESIQIIIDGLSLSRNDNLILCGASMAGHICLAAALRAKKMGVRGVIPCEAAAHLPLSQPIYEISGADAAVLDPERVSGMIAPMSPEEHKKQIWWQYSSQGTNIFAGDLKFYFKGWDGRARLKGAEGRKGEEGKGIDTKYCPVYMLTGEFDYSCTVEMSRETKEMIGEGAEFEAMEGLGHFPLSENPGKVLGYLERAIEGIQKRRE